MFLREFVDAFRKEGLKVGSCYSILDYHHGVENGKVTRKEIEFIKAQLTELLTNYGPIDYMNFDGWATWPSVPTFDDIPYAELYKTVKAIQPECLIVNHVYESNLAHADVPFADAAGRAYPYHPDYIRPTAASDILQFGWWWDDKNGEVRRSVDYLLKQLDSYNSHNSVYVLNISPNPAGRLSDDAVKRLAEVAKAWQRLPDLEKAGEDWGFQYDVSTNLAFIRPATQSSTHPFILDERAYPRAEIAVDGVTEAKAKLEQTSVTDPKSESQPWWQVDLERECRVKRLKIYTRTDGDEPQLENSRVMLLDHTGKTVWEHKQASEAPAVLDLETDETAAQFVRVELEGEGILCLGEVIVEGE